MPLFSHAIPQELDCGVQAAKLMVKTKAQKNEVDS